LGLGIAYQETTFRTKIGAGPPVRARGASKEFRTPYLFPQPLKLATSNLVDNLGTESNLPRTNFNDQNSSTI